MRYHFKCCEWMSQWGYRKNF